MRWKTGIHLKAAEFKEQGRPDVPMYIFVLFPFLTKIVSYNIFFYNFSFLQLLLAHPTSCFHVCFLFKKIK